MNARPFFLDAGDHRMFAVHHLPEAGATVRGNILCISGFNEENNRCRSMLTLQASALAAAGFGTLVVDLFGTGDSDGEYGEATWPAWLQDIETAASWLALQPGGLSALLGVRLGAILAAQSAASMRAKPAALLLWQPVIDGRIHLTQFLRVRIAAKLDVAGAKKETTASMRQQLMEGQPVEVGGYELSPALCSAIDAARLADHPPAPGSKTLWLERVEPPESRISAPSESLLQAWRGSGAAVEAHGYEGPAFWQVHERVVTPSILDLTMRWVGQHLATR